MWWRGWGVYGAVLGRGPVSDGGGGVRRPRAYGTFDQAGNVYEWTEGLDPPFLRYFWGGSFATRDGGRNVRVPNRDYSSQAEDSIIGFRIAGAVAGENLETSPAEDSPVNRSAVVRFPRRPWPHPQTGKPYFPLAWFTWGSDQQDLDDMAAEGVNTVLFVSSPTDVDQSDAQLEKHLAAMTAYLDHAHQRGIKVLIQCGWYDAFRDNDPAYVGACGSMWNRWESIPGYWAISSTTSRSTRPAAG